MLAIRKTPISEFNRSQPMLSLNFLLLYPTFWSTFYCRFIKPGVVTLADCVSFRGSATKKVWTRQDALQCLNVEFWLCRPEHQAGEQPDFNCPEPDGSHPDYDLYLRIWDLITEYYDGIENGELDDETVDGDTSMANSADKGKEPAGSKRASPKS